MCPPIWWKRWPRRSMPTCSVLPKTRLCWRTTPNLACSKQKIMAEETAPKRTNRVTQAFKALGAPLFSGSKNARVSEIPPVATQWSADVFSSIEWRRFEAVCARLFEQAGFRTQLQPRSPDGGAEIWLHSRNAKGPVAILLCRHWLGKNVGVTELREFVNLLASHQLTRGTFATVATYTPSALRFAKAHSINALDNTGLLALIAKRTPAQQQELLDVAYEGEYWRPTCARCGIKMEERTPSRGGAQFWACSNFPQCKAWLPMAAAKT
ncbi:MAG: restriction endonuclease [Burkholderiales bacterium]|nr:restriction endonuclease [Burkholderiales bacterium]